MNNQKVIDRINKIYPENKYTYLMFVILVISVPFVFFGVALEFDFSNASNLSPFIYLGVFIFIIFQIISAVKSFKNFKIKSELLTLLEQDETAFLQRIVELKEKLDNNIFNRKITLFSEFDFILEDLKTVTFSKRDVDERFVGFIKREFNILRIKFWQVLLITNLIAPLISYLMIYEDSEDLFFFIFIIFWLNLMVLLYYNRFVKNAREGQFILDHYRTDIDTVIKHCNDKIESLRTKKLKSNQEKYTDIPKYEKVLEHIERMKQFENNIFE